MTSSNRKETLDLLAVTSLALQTADTCSETARIFFDSACTRPRFAVGKNSDTSALAGLCALAGIVDDFSPPGSKWQGIPLVRVQDVPEASLVANCSSSISPVSVARRLEGSGISRVFSLNEIVAASNGRLQLPVFARATRAELAANGHVWQVIYDSLADEESRRTLLDVVRFRLTADPSYMRKYRIRPSEQYFEEFVRMDGETFVDAGGFDGDSSEIFIQKCPNYRKIFLIEPSLQNIKIAKERLAHFPRIEYIDKGLSDASGTLKFNVGAGSASSVSQESFDTIQVDTLDALIPEPVSFIKMDLEGWELKALAGARNHIMRARPKIAVAVYHNAADFRDTFNWIHDLGLGYDVYIRHYTEGWSESIMYFIPPLSHIFGLVNKKLD
jgi:FkbM family methyltransferase